MEEELVVEIVEYVTYALIASTGDIISIGECLAEDVASQAETGETVVLNPPANITDESHYYKNGLFKAYPAKPSQWHTFNYTTETWVDSKPTDVNAEFDVADYTIEPSITVSGNTLSIAAFTATRENGSNIESKSRSAATLTYPGKASLVAYNYDANTITFYNDFASLNSAPRRFLIGEFKATGVFVPASLLVDGGSVATNTVGTPQLAPLAVTSTELALAAVGKEHLQVDSITASKIGVTDLTNIIPDSEMMDADAWVLPAKWTRGTNPSGTSFSAPGYLNYNATGLTSGYSAAAQSKRFPVEAGREYLIKYQTNSGSGNTNGVWGRVHWFSATGVEVTPYTIIGDPVSGTGTRDFRQKAVPPAGAKYGEMQFYVNHERTSSNVSISSLMCRIMANAELIVDGAIQGVHVETDTLEGRHFKADSINVRELNIGGFEDIILNSDLINADGWTLANGAEHITSGLPTGTTAPGLLRFPPITSGESVAQWSKSTKIPVKPGEKYTVECEFRASGTNANFRTRIVIWQYRADGSYIGAWVGGIRYQTNAAFQPISVEYTVPNEVTRIMVGFGRTGDENANGHGYVQFPSLRKKVTGELIVNGQIVTEHVMDRAITNQYFYNVNSKIRSVTVTCTPSSEFIFYVKGETRLLAGSGGLFDLWIKELDASYQAYQIVYAPYDGSVAVVFDRAGRTNTTSRTFDFECNTGIIRQIVIQEFKR